MATILAKLDKYYFPQDLRCTNNVTMVSSPVTYNAVKIILFLVMVTCQVLNLSHMTKFTDNFIYLTEWGLWITTFYTFLSALDALSCFLKNKNLYPNVYKPRTILFHLAFAFETTITIIFWTVLMPPDIKDGKLSSTYLVVNFAEHLVPLLVCWIDFIFNALPCDSWRPITYYSLVSVCYFVVNFTYTMATGHPIYAPITYKDVMSYVYMVVSMILLVGQYALMRFIYRRFKKEIVVEMSKQVIPFIEDNGA